MPGKRVIELGSRLDVFQELLSEGDGASEFGLSLQYPIAHAFQLGSGKVPLVCHLILFKILIDGLEHSHLIPIFAHSLHIGFRHGQLDWGYQVYLDVLEYRQAVGLGVHGPAMEEVSDQGKVQRIAAPVVVLKEGELIQQLLRRMLMLSVPCIDEGGLR